MEYSVFHFRDRWTKLIPEKNNWLKYHLSLSNYLFFSTFLYLRDEILLELLHLDLEQKASSACIGGPIWQVIAADSLYLSTNNGFISFISCQ